jgi:hypothetical protein
MKASFDFILTRLSGLIERAVLSSSNVLLSRLFYVSILVWSGRELGWAF